MSDWFQKALRQSNLNASFLFIALAGTALRFAVSAWGHNYDFDSYLIVARIGQDGGNVYAETERYNYGPAWMGVLSVFYSVAGGNETVFRLLLITLLCLADLGIFLFLTKRYHLLAGGLFFLNPISIIVTGYHNQFDNLALLFALLAAGWIGERDDAPLDRKKYAGLIALGMSLVIKHVFFLYPFWLAVKQKKAAQALIVFLLPMSLFLVSFLPYRDLGGEGILKNVFFYRSYANEYFYRMFVPPFFKPVLTSHALWMLSLAAFGVYFRRRDTIESLLLYSCILVFLSPAITNQYLAIPLSFVAAYINPAGAAYTLVGTLHLLTDMDGLNWLGRNWKFAFREIFYALSVLLLCAAFIWSIWGKRIISAIKFLAQKIRHARKIHG